MKHLPLECTVMALMSIWSYKSLLHLLSVGFIDFNQLWIRWRSETISSSCTLSVNVPCWNLIMSFINLSAAERRTSHGTKPQTQTLERFFFFFSQTNELPGLRRGSGLRIKLWMWSCPEHLDSREAKSVATPRSKLTKTRNVQLFFFF